MLLMSKLASLNAKMQSAQQVGQTEVDAGTRSLVKKAVVDPASLTTTAEVAELDPNAAGATLSQQTGQLSSDVSATPTADSCTYCNSGRCRLLLLRLRLLQALLNLLLLQLHKLPLRLKAN